MKTGADTYGGIGFMNVFDGSAADFITPGKLPMVGEPGAGLADVSLAFTVRVGSNAWANPNWQSGASDPMIFTVGEGGEIPEPATMPLVGLGATVLGAVRRRRS